MCVWGGLAQEMWDTIQSRASRLGGLVLSHQRLLNFIIVPVSRSLFLIILPPFLNLRPGGSDLRCRGCVTLYSCHQLRNSALNFSFYPASVTTSGSSPAQHAFQDAGDLDWWGCGLMNQGHSHRQTRLMQYLCLLPSVTVG